MYIHRAVRPKKVKRKAGQETNKEKKKDFKSTNCQGMFILFQTFHPSSFQGIMCVYVLWFKYCSFRLMPAQLRFPWNNKR